MNQPTPEDLTEDVQVVKVRQPYAHYLAEGIKDIENRSFELKARFPVWCVIAASKSLPTNAAMSDVATRLTTEVTTPRREFPTGVMVGMVRIVGCFDPENLPWDSVWYNPPDKAWAIDKAWKFRVPIPLDEHDKFQTRVGLDKRPEYRRLILEQMSEEGAVAVTEN